MDWTQIIIAILTSEPMVGVYAVFFAWLWHWIGDRFKINVERWNGLIAFCFLLAEKSGKTGEGKLAFACDELKKQFSKVYGKEITLRDLWDAELDFARLALEQKFSPAAAEPR